MKELLNQLATKNGRVKNSKFKTKIMLDDERVTNALIAKLTAEATKEHIHKKRDPSIGANENENVKFEKDTINITSAEELENILQKLKFMGAKGKRVMELLKKQILLNEEVESTTSIPPKSSPEPSTTASTMSSSDSSSTPNPLNIEIKETESIEENLLRQKREFILRAALKSKELNEDEESANLAIEEVRH